jgi:hypothetical protein
MLRHKKFCGIFRCVCQLHYVFSFPESPGRQQHYVFFVLETPGRQLHYVFSFLESPGRQLHYVFFVLETPGRKIHYVIEKNSLFPAESQTAGIAPVLYLLLNS